jgi:hypothetical protein
MTVTNVCFCTYQGNFGLVRSFDHGHLTITFDTGTIRLRPNQVTFL